MDELIECLSRISLIEAPDDAQLIARHLSDPGALRLLETVSEFSKSSGVPFYTLIDFLIKIEDTFPGSSDDTEEEDEGCSCEVNAGDPAYRNQVYYFDNKGGIHYVVNHK